MKKVLAFLTLLMTIPLLSVADITPTAPTNTPIKPYQTPQQQSLLTQLKQKPSFSNALDNWLDRRRCFNVQRQQNVLVTSYLSKGCQVPYTHPRNEVTS
jgi:hypothetical protein